MQGSPSLTATQDSNFLSICVQNHEFQPVQTAQLVALDLLD